MKFNTSAVALVALWAGMQAAKGQQSPPAVFTSAQADAGRVLYEKTCGQCHTPTLRGRTGEPGELPPVSSLSDRYQKFIGPRGAVPPLVGPLFLSHWGSVAARDLVARFQETVDFFQLQENKDTTIDITAYILQQNGAKAGTQPLTWSTNAIVNSVVAAPAEFEVASVKAARNDARTWAIREVTPERYRSVSNVTQLITWAWKVKNFQIVGAPAWLPQERFEIQATTGHEAADGEIRAMVQGLLADRFGLKVHRERKEIPVYALMVAKGGHKLTASEGRVEGKNPTPRGINFGAGVLTGRDAAMGELVDVLTDHLDRPVLDKTDLAGRYDFSLGLDQPVAPPAGTAWSPIGAALFTLIHDLGMRLEATKDSVEMLVVDSITRPGEN